MNLYLGCPIWSFRGWVGNFYPKGTKPNAYLHEYARRLTAVEGNTTFYAVPSQDTLKTWAAEMPETFRFCPKLPKAISHRGKLAGHIQEAQAFTQVMSQLGSRCGPMFLQLPPSYTPGNLEDLRTFLQAWPSKVRLAVEVRHLDWFDREEHQNLVRLLTEMNMAGVIIDTRPIRSLAGDKILKGSVYQTLLEAREQKPDVPILPERTSDFVFLRYIGHPHLEINKPVLDEWGNYLTNQLRQETNAYVFCHSPENMAAPWLCRELHQRVARKIKIPSLPWDKADSESYEQEQLL